MTGESRLRIGSLLWISAVQFFVVQAVVAAGWPTPFDLAERNISELGNTVRSPWAALMNASFVTIGVTMAAGGVLTQAAFTTGLRRTIAVLMFTLAGVGVIVVGLYPENEASAPHVAGAGLNFVAGNIALILFGLALPVRRRLMRAFSLTAGLVGLAGTALFAAGVDLGIGSGLMERVAVYPMPIWQSAAGYTFIRLPVTTR
jgi:hypothetical membrane protein